MKPNTKVRTGLYAGIGLLVIVALVLAVILPLASRSNNTNTGARPTETQTVPSANTPQPTQVPTATPTPGDTNPAQESGVRRGPQACPASVSNPGYWDRIVGTTSGVNKVESVSCASILGTPSLQAVVTVRSSGSVGKVDVYVYTTITSATPAQIFKLQGLLKGDAKISGYNTVMTAEADENSPINKGKPDAQLRQYLYREYKWSDGAGILVQVAFPGLFPDLTRYQAEEDQAQQTAGSWKYNAATVAKYMAIQMFKWASTSQATLISGGGPQDVGAFVNVRSTGPDHSVITVELSRLEGNTHHIWEVVGVTSNNLAITWPPNGALLTSPVKVTGPGNAFEGQVGVVYVLDHLSNPIGQAIAKGAQGMGPTTFSASVSYTATFHGGAQEGILAVYSSSNADGAIAGVYMQKAMIQA